MNWLSRNKFLGAWLSASIPIAIGISSGSTPYKIGSKLRSLVSFLKTSCYRRRQSDALLAFSKEHRSETVCRNTSHYKTYLKERSFDTIKSMISLSNSPLKTKNNRSCTKGVDGGGYFQSIPHHHLAPVNHFNTSPNNLKLPLWIGCLLLCSLFACHDKAALTQALIDETVIQKVASHQRKKIKTCKEEAMREALIIADSVMIKLALSKVDTTGQGNRPVKPARPELDLPVDTTPIKPLFEDTIIRLEDTAILLEKPKLVEKDTLLKDTLKKG